jgi:hypothetical protein
MVFPQYSLNLFIIMKKVLFFILMFFGLASYAQTPQSITVDYNKTKVPGVSIVIGGYDADFVQNALQYRLEKVAGLKGTNSKGFRLYASQSFPEFGRLNYDIFTLVNKGSKNDKSVSVTLMLSKGNDNFISPHDDPELTEKMKDFLTEFNDYMKEYERVQRIDNLTTLIGKLEKEHNSLVVDTDKLKKEISDRETKLKDKEKELSKTESELENAKNELNSLKK